MKTILLSFFLFTSSLVFAQTTEPDSTQTTPPDVKETTQKTGDSTSQSGIPDIKITADSLKTKVKQPIPTTPSDSLSTSQPDAVTPLEVETPKAAGQSDEPTEPIQPAQGNPINTSNSETKDSNNKTKNKAQETQRRQKGQSKNSANKQTTSAKSAQNELLNTNTQVTTTNTKLSDSLKLIIKKERLAFSDSLNFYQQQLKTLKDQNNALNPEESSDLDMLWRFLPLGILGIVLLLLIFSLFQRQRHQKTLLKQLTGKADHRTQIQMDASIAELKDQRVNDKILQLQKGLDSDLGAIKAPVDQLFLFLKDQIPSLHEQEQSNHEHLFEQLDHFKSSIEHLLDELSKALYTKESYFLTPYLMNEEVRQLGEFLKLENSEASANEFHKTLNTVNATKEELKANILKLTETEKEIEDNIITEALERLNKYKAFALMIGEEIADRFELSSKIKLFHEDPKKLATLSPEKIKEEQQRAKESYASGRRLLRALTKTGLAEKYESPAGIPFNEDIHHVRGPKETDNPALNEIIYKSLAPGIKMGEEVIIPERVIYYSSL